MVRVIASPACTGLVIHSMTPGGMRSQLGCWRAAAPESGPITRHGRARDGADEARRRTRAPRAHRRRNSSSRDRSADLLEKRTRTGGVLRGVDRVELLRIERIEQRAAIIAIGRDDEHGPAAWSPRSSGDPPAIAQTRQRAHFGIELSRCKEPSISSGTFKFAPRNGILRSFPV